MPSPQEDTGFKTETLAMNAVRAQRVSGARPGEYLCQKCQTQFKFDDVDPEKLQCPKCQNKKAESLTAFYTEEDPARDEMLGKNEFAAGD
ncbi:MAG TPA: hypothetical protein V6C76_13335 [Drouetiella sp.]